MSVKNFVEQNKLNQRDKLTQSIVMLTEGRINEDMLRAPTAGAAASSPANKYR